MLTGETTYRTIYADTDQMGVVYYGNYGKFYEMGRSEMVRELGFAYKQLEDLGYFMPVSEVKAKYHKSLFYDEVIRIKTTLKELPKVRMVFHHEIYNSQDELVHTAEVTLVFLSAESNRPVRVPAELLKSLTNVAVWR